ncbi:hypothetical protein [Deinococcus sonorensis]|uniref:Uncharacterized protein n=1 Tax=Deinococcus sonorensis TaxID=309891 RepID=A0ABV8Y8C1_9DEIO
MSVSFLHARPRVTPRLFTAVLALYLVWYALFFHGHLPFSLTALGEVVPGALPLDLRFHYPASDAITLLSTLGEDGRQAYRRVLMADAVYPVLFALVQVLANQLSVRALGRPGTLRTLVWLPAVPMLLDLLENAGLWWLLGHPQPPAAVAAVVSVVTTAKHVTSLLALATCGVLALWAAVARWRRFTSTRTGH